MQKYIEYIRKYRTQEEEVRDRIQEILESDYQDVYDFFLKYLSSDYPYIVLMSRRCLVLCQIFTSIFILEKKKWDAMPLIISDKGIYAYRKSMKGKKVCILDDILIHGRALGEIYDRIYKYAGVEPDAAVYVKNSSADYGDININKKVNSIYEYSAAVWRPLSDRFVSCIYAATAPYTSYVAAFSSYEALSSFEKLRENKALVFDDISKEMQKEYHLEAYCSYEKNGFFAPVFESLCLEKCVRFYVDRAREKVLVIPYVFIKSFNLKQVDTLLESFSESLPAKLNGIKHALIQPEDGERNYQTEYKLMLLTCILSNLYWIYYKRTYSLNMDWFMDTDTITKSFGKEISGELEKMMDMDLSSLYEFEYSDREHPVDITDEETRYLCEQLEKSVHKNKESVVRDYFQKAWALDEKRAKEHKSRLHGLTTELFTKKIPLSEGPQYWIYNNLINSWDTGIAASRCDISSDGTVAGCFNVPGEQSYRILLETYPYLMKSLVFLSRNICAEKIHAVTEQQFIEKKTALLEGLVVKFEEKFQIEMNEVKELIREENGSLETWNNTSIFYKYLDKDVYKDEELVKNYSQMINQ